MPKAITSAYAFSIRYNGGISNNFKSAFDLQIQALRLKRSKELNEKHSLTYGANLVRYGIYLALWLGSTYRFFRSHVWKWNYPNRSSYDEL